ncbi:hypothetical protein PCC7424_1880 [Gloeothece citriformis PCC 7424]|uniref:Uncharacterized protein n=1 Tax=Gloeothece citriformis (strain PCC 7424) TaxID=65393 RepID=B7KDL0_GLOC7|nr:hypothetical protein [Gloeothece citriformis]ACK70312.1 hypothetical protein PCC7424_1880 [Gloeothece citriformis PCC 7424]
MSIIKPIKLYNLLEKECPNWIIQFKDYNESTKTFFKLGSQEFFKDRELLIKAVSRNLNKTGKEIIIVINMKEFDFLSPSAANVTASGCLEISKHHRVPIVFTQVYPEVLESLKTARSTLETEERILWAIDQNNQHHLLKPVRESLQKILDVLEKTKTITASSLAALNEESPSKKVINRFSVYLQELFNLGLLTREKVDGLDRNEAGRGWTYVYSPAYVDVLEIFM